MKIFGFLIFLFMVMPLCAQQSASFILEEHVFNGGGHPADGTIMASAGFSMTLDALGDTVAAVVTASSPSFSIELGFVPTYPPPTEVLNLKFSDKSTLYWDLERSEGTYNLYRGELGDLPLLDYGSCLQQEITGTTTSDSSSPIPETGYFYLVTVDNRVAEEGTKGYDSSPAERLGTVCP